MFESIPPHKNQEIIHEYPLKFNQSGELLAPNGEISRFNHNLRVAKFIRTPDFLAWFGDWINGSENTSVAVYEDTQEPILFFHRSRFKLSQNEKLSVAYDTTFGGPHGLVNKTLYFTTGNLLEYGPFVHSVFLHLRNPAAEWKEATEVNDGVLLHGHNEKGGDFYHACIFSDEQVFELSRTRDKYPLEKS